MKALRKLIPAIAAAVLFSASALAQDDGRFKEMGANQLEGTQNPYLAYYVYHAFNWHEWNDATIDKAIDGKKTIFMVIGSYDCANCAPFLANKLNATMLAANFNSRYINVMVDADERPDIAQVYRAASEMQEISIDLPFIAFLTNDLSPVYSGGYLAMAKLGLSLSLLSDLFAMAERASSEIGKGSVSVDQLMHSLNARYGDDKSVLADAALAAQKIGRNTPEMTRREDYIMEVFTALGSADKETVNDAVTAMLEAVNQPTDKSVTARSGLMIEALARAGAFLETAEHVESAMLAADFLLDNLKRDDGGLYRLYADGKAFRDGFLDDYAYLARGLTVLHTITGDTAYLDAAKSLAGYIDAHFKGETGGYFFTPDTQNTRTVRIYTARENDDLPAPNAVLAHVFMDLFEIEKQQDWLKKAGDTLSAFGRRARAEPAYHATWFGTLQRYQTLSKTGKPE